MQISLPVPGPDEREHSERLQATLKAWVAEHGPMPFAAYMERCLYAPGLGYYSAGAVKFGAAGDFVTAPELGSLFARCVAQTLAPQLRDLGPEACWLELGGGSGAFTVDVLMALCEMAAVPRAYWILEPSADLRQRQRQRIEQQLPTELAARVVWLDQPPAQDWNGVLFANEVIDALPASRFCRHSGRLYEQCVGLGQDGALQLLDQPAGIELETQITRLEHDLGSSFAEGYRSEYLPQLAHWLQAISASLRRGVLLFVDYGYPRREYYREDRRDGTLMAYYRHRAHTDPLFWPGLNDLTTSVDFTALAEAAQEVGLTLELYTTQAHFLLAGNLSGHFEQVYAQVSSEAERLSLAQQVRTLTLPERMGERFQAMLFSRGPITAWPETLAVTDLRRRL